MSFEPGANTPFVYSSRVRFVDTDASARIHYTAMFRHFEAAEMEFFRHIGLSYPDIARAGYSFPRVRVECQYTGAVGYEDLLDIAVRVERLGRASFTLGFAASLAGRPVAEGRITVVCMDIATQRSRPLPEDFRQVLESTCTPESER